MGFEPNRPVQAGGMPPSTSMVLTGDEPFSRRFGYRGQAAAITVREDAPASLRNVVVDLARLAGVSPDAIREIVCRVLRQAPDPMVRNSHVEASNLLSSAPWYRVYDVIESVYEFLRDRKPHGAIEFEKTMNDVLQEEGIGWQLVEGRLETRGPETFERGVRDARRALHDAGFSTASNELNEALRDLSRRPSPDITGAIQHSMAALEAVARTACGDQKATLGEIMKRHDGLIPRPLDVAVVKAWGYASDSGRHLREGREPQRDEAELIVGIVAAVATYLVRKHDS